MQNKIIKFQIIFGILASLFLFLPLRAQAAVPDPPKPYAEVNGDSEDNLSVLVTWDINSWTTSDKNEYGYKVEKEGANGKATVATYNPIDAGHSVQTNGGFYLDEAVAPNETYTYYVTAFDRFGEESAPASTTVFTAICEDDFTTFEGKVDGSKVTLSWNPICEAVEYKLYRDNKEITITEQSSYEDNNVPVGEHEYKIEAYDQKISRAHSNLVLIPKAYAAVAPIKTKTTKVKVESATAKASKCTKGAKGVTTDFGWVCNIADYVNKLLPWIMGIVGGLAVLMLVYAGYIYMTSQGNPERVSLAKDIIIGVIIGIILLFIIEVILKTIGIR